MKSKHLIAAGAVVLLVAASPTWAFEPIIVMGDASDANREMGVKEVLATGAQTDAQITILIGNDEPGTNTGGVMVHSQETEMFYVLEGTYEFTVGDQTFEGGTGTFVAVPAGVPRTFVAKTQGRLMLIYTPGGFDQFFKDWEDQGLVLGPDLGPLEAIYGVTRP